MIYAIRMTEAGLQYVIEVLKTRPIGEAGELFEDVRAQAKEQEAAEQKRVRDEIIASAAPVVAEAA